MNKNKNKKWVKSIDKLPFLDESSIDEGSRRLQEAVYQCVQRKFEQIRSRVEAFAPNELEDIMEKVTADHVIDYMKLKGKHIKDEYVKKLIADLSQNLDKKGFNR